MVTPDNLSLTNSTENLESFPLYNIKTGNKFEVLTNIYDFNDADTALCTALPSLTHKTGSVMFANTELEMKSANFLTEQHEEEKKGMKRGAKRSLKFYSR